MFGVFSSVAAGDYLNYERDFCELTFLCNTDTDQRRYYQHCLLTANASIDSMSQHDWFIEVDMLTIVF